MSICKVHYQSLKLQELCLFTFYILDLDFEKSEYYKPKVSTKPKDEKVNVHVSKKAEAKVKRSTASVTTKPLSNSTNTLVMESSLLALQTV